MKAIKLAGMITVVFLLMTGFVSADTEWYANHQIMT
jgi:hypothetical protein